VNDRFGELNRHRAAAEGQFLTRDLGGSAMTIEFTEAIIHAL